MKLAFLPLDNLVVSKTNMRFQKKEPDVTDMLPTVRKRGVIQPVVVRPNCAADMFEIVAGWRRYVSARIVADERRARGDEVDLMPCAILDEGDDADAIEISLIENIARLDADEVTQWATFTRLVKEGRTPDDIGATFGLPDLAVKRVLALGNLLPRIRAMYAREDIDATTIRHLTLASKRQQQDWLKLVDDPEARAPTGQAAKAWLLGGQSIPARHALFDPESSGVATVADLFGEDRFFADASAFWTAQDAAIEARREAYLAEGWSAVVILPKTDYFHTWEYEKTPKKKGGRVYIDVRATGEVAFHEGYVGRKEAERAARGAAVTTSEKAKRPELTSGLQAYIDLHRHAAVRAELVEQPGAALRLMVAHVVIGSPLWTVRREPQAARDEATHASVEKGAAEAWFDARRRAVLGILGLPIERETLVANNGDDYDLVRLFLRLLDLPDAGVLDVLSVAMGETLMAGSAAVEAVGQTLGVAMAQWWRADAAFYELIRDKEVLVAIVAEVAGDAVAGANAKEKGATLKRIIADHLDGTGGREKVEAWVPKWMSFPPSAYTDRGGVGTVRASAKVMAARAGDEPDPTAPEGLALVPEPEDKEEMTAANDDRVTPDALAA